MATSMNNFGEGRGSANELTEWFDERGPALNCKMCWATVQPIPPMPADHIRWHKALSDRLPGDG